MPGPGVIASRIAAVKKRKNQTAVKHHKIMRTAWFRVPPFADYGCGKLHQEFWKATRGGDLTDTAIRRKFNQDTGAIFFHDFEIRFCAELPQERFQSPIVPGENMTGMAFEAT
jgi:hypothetical protein